MKFYLKKHFSYLYGKIVRASGTPSYIARGWSLGVFIGCVIPMSCQLMISIPLSFVLRGSKIGATLGTFITNPVSVIVLYPAQCYIGNKIIGGELSFAAVKSALGSIISPPPPVGEQTAFVNFFVNVFDNFAGLTWDLIISFFVGGLLFALVCTPLTYFFVYQAVLRYRNFRETHRLKIRARRAAKAAAKAANQE